MSTRTILDSIGLPSSAVALGLVAAAAITLAPGSAHAQDPNAPPPGGYYVPPPAPGAYYAPPAAYQGPRVITDWDDGQPIPAGYHQSTRIRTGLVVGGAVLFGVCYLMTAISGAIASDVGGNHTRSAKLLLIPVAGPFSVLSTGSTTADLFLALDGLAQAGGVAMLIAGIAAPKTVLVRDASNVKIKPVPMTFGGNGGGLGVVGTF